jgi:Holliday junction resolvasome RuvABC endonuclease subunit
VTARLSMCGIDVSSQKGIAFAWLDAGGNITYRKLHTDLELRGARRLVQIRAASTALAVRQMGNTGCCLVEIPWAARDDSFVLLSITGVVLEAVQAGAPHLAVMEVPTAQWKRWSVGKGNASKDEYRRHALNLGYEGNDEDIAAAVCMAQAAWNRYERRAA